MTARHAPPAAPITLYRYALSGHAHRAQLALSLLDLPHVLVDVDLKQGEHKQPAFLRLNPFGQVPVIDDAGTVVHDSNAILVYLATRHDPARRWLPTAPEAQAAVQVWLSAAAGPIAFGPAAARLVTVFGAKLDADGAIARAHQLLRVMEPLLASRSFLVGEGPTIADIAGYSYISAAPEGNVDLAPYPAVRAWLQRIEALPGFVPFPKTAVGLAA
ncbi:glutathione S-transferase [Aquincola tertiaricarbonis]|uniref:Glutathione S-transferase n=1 Tax=Aquincola tertiaricarbonis TaxID=391953 RepID=A0ABY4RZL3_AQUTE|nr:glutathione S-transferase [Aquincola tertiaricarbonis]URI06383.1 glutathione S-transferase [Aquincola tertiaricarbonis]